MPFPNLSNLVVANRFELENSEPLAWMVNLSEMKSLRE